jgi:hypothetical protein
MLSQAVAKRIEHRLLDKFISYPKNPRRLSDAQIAHVVQSRDVSVNQAVTPKQQDARRIRHNALAPFLWRPEESELRRGN